MVEILENVDATKKEKFNQKYNRLSEQSWTRDNFESNMQDVLNAIDNIEDFITGLQDEIDSIRGDKPGVDSDFDEIKESFNDAAANDVSDLQSTSMVAGFNPTLKALDVKRQELVDKLQKINEWKTLQGELSRLAMQKLFELSKGYKTEFVNSEVAQKFEDHAEQKIEDKMDKMKQEIYREVERDIADLEQAVNAARNETKNVWTFMQTWAEEFGNSKLVEVPESALDEGLDQFAAGDGTVDLSGEAQQVEETKSERDEARESAVEDSLGKSGTTEESDDSTGDEDDGDKSTREELVENWDDYYSMMKQSDVADELGVSEARISKLKKQEDLD